MRNRIAVGVAVTLLLVGYVVGRASDAREATLTARVSSSDHEVTEGYFTLGENTTVIAKPGSDLHRFLSGQRGRKVTLHLTADSRELSRLHR